MGKTITAKQFYSGFDPASGQDFTLQQGESTEVSDEKIEQLERDGLIDRFEVGKAAAKTGSGDGLDELTVPELKKKAGELQIEIEGKATKPKLLEAIRKKQAESPAPADDLADLDRDVLIERAASIGLADPADLDDDELRAGIRSAQGGTEAGVA